MSRLTRAQVIHEIFTGVDSQDSDQVANILSLYEQTAKNEGYEQGHLHGFLTGVLVGAVLGVLAAFLCGAWYFSTVYSGESTSLTL